MRSILYEFLYFSRLLTDGLSYCVQLQASAYLESLLRHEKADRSSLPYVSFDPDGVTGPDHVTRAACKGTACLLETNVALLPDDTIHSSNNIRDILELAETNLRMLGQLSPMQYITYPPSRAVDGDLITFFKSALSALMLLPAWDTKC